MKFKIGLIGFVIVIIGVAFFVFQNSADIQLNLYPGEAIHLPLSLLIIISIIFGALIMFLISLGIELKLRMKSRKVEKLLKKKINSLENLKRGLINFLSGKIKNAKKDFNNALKTDNENFVPLIFLKDIEDKKNIEATINKLPVELRKFYLIDYFYNQKSFENVIELGEEFLKDSSFSNIEILKKIRDAHLKLKNFDKAIEIQNRIDKKDEILEEIYYLKAKSLNDAIAIDDFIKKFPQNVAGYMLKFEKYNDADILKEGFKKTKNEVFIYKLFQKYINDNDNKAEKYLLKLNSIPLAQFFKAYMLFKKGELQSAKKLVQNLTDNKDLKIISSLLFAEIIYREEGELKESFENLRKVLNIDDLELFEFICNNCKNSYSDWSDFCNNCKKFNSLSLKWLK